MNSKFSLYNKNLSTKGNVEALFVTLLLFFMTSPYFFWQWYGQLLPKIVVTTIAVLIFGKNRGNILRRDINLMFFFVLIWLFYTFNELFKGARLGVLATVPYLLLCIVPFVKREFARTVFSNFFNIYTVLIGLSMISWLAAVSGLISPIGQFGMGNNSLEAQNKSYLVYPLSLVMTSSIAGESQFFRFCGVFDEPGVVGTLSALILCSMRFNIKDWRCLVILFSGLLSASFFFYVLVAIYWVVYLIMVRKRYGTVLFLIVGITLFYLTTKDNEAISFLVWDRFEWDASRGTFAGDSRSDERIVLLMQRMWKSGEIWLGVADKEKFWNEFFGTSAIYDIIAQYGVVFTFLYLLWVILIGYRYRTSKWDFILYIFVVISCSYQRPGIFNILYIFLYACLARYGEFFIDSTKQSKGIDNRIVRHIQSRDVTINI